jgi:hypothetical protein
MFLCFLFDPLKRRPHPRSPPLAVRQKTYQMAGAQVEYPPRQIRNAVPAPSGIDMQPSTGDNTRSPDEIPT